MKTFYSMIDGRLTSPQPEQHEFLQKKARKEGGEIVFYGAEEYRCFRDQPFILNKLRRTPGVTDVVFFTFEQFCYGDKLNLKLMKEIISSGYGLHFAREDLSLNSLQDIVDNLPVFLAYFYACKQKDSPSHGELLRGIL